MRNERGITLIALVITIVVLLILAGVTITYALGDNGLFSNAKKAELNSELGNIRDYAAMAKFDVATTYYTDAKLVEGQDAILKVIANNFPGYPDGAITAETNALTATNGSLVGKYKVALQSANKDGKTNAEVTVSDDGKITVEAK